VGFAVAAFMAILAALLPVGLTPRCGGVMWRNFPVACWQYSVAALVDRVEGNMAATRSFAFSVVRVNR